MYYVTVPVHMWEMWPEIPINKRSAREVADCDCLEIRRYQKWIHLDTCCAENDSANFWTSVEMKEPCYVLSLNWNFKRWKCPQSQIVVVELPLKCIRFNEAVVCNIFKKVCHHFGGSFICYLFDSHLWMGTVIQYISLMHYNHDITLKGVGFVLTYLG